MEERRKARRLRTYLGGQVEFNPRCPSLECLVRNMSPNGARLIFPRPPAIPETFDLTIHQTGDSRRARIIWRTEKEAGVSFLENETGIVVSLEAARRIKALEAERDVLAKRVAQFSDQP
jgi:hypothetical protein